MTPEMKFILDNYRFIKLKHFGEEYEWFCGLNCSLCPFVSNMTHNQCKSDILKHLKIFEEMHPEVTL